MVKSKGKQHRIIWKETFKGIAIALMQTVEARIKMTVGNVKIIISINTTPETS